MASLHHKLTWRRYFLGRYYHAVSTGTDRGVGRSVLHSEILHATTSKLGKRTPSQEVLVIRDSVRDAAITLAAGMKVAVAPDCTFRNKKWYPAAIGTNTLTDVRGKLSELPSMEYGRNSSCAFLGHQWTTQKAKPCSAAAGKRAMSTFKAVSHALFDLDGLLLDTEKLYSRAAEILASRYGKKFTWDLDRRVLGTPDFDAARTIVESLGLPITSNECMEKLNEICHEFYHDCDLMPGAERLLRHLKAHGVPMAVATSTTPALFDLKMSRHGDLAAFFHHVVCTGGGH
ncbi:hypothetical protein MTO96_015333 [Rhipicephalus appendiculatus]